MKILALHARYITLGGEDVSHDTEVSFLRASGYDVLDHRVDNSDFAKNALPKQVAKTVYNKAAYRQVRTLLEDFRPDLVYVNNTFPGLSVSPIIAGNDLKIPVVQVLRNYRRGCLAGSTFRDGAECTVCVGHTLALPGVFHKCYRSSMAASAVAAASKFIQAKQGWLDTADRYVAVSHHVREHATAAGIPTEKLVVRHNLVWPEPTPLAPALNSKVSPFVYVGRDTPEKGLHVLLDAVARVSSPDLALEVYGCEAPRDYDDSRVSFLGAVPPARALEAMGAALRVIVPSTWPEPFGRVVIEALACGTPVIASRVGGMAHLGGAGVDLFAPGNSGELSIKLASVLQRNRADLERDRVDARQQFTSEFSPERWLETTESVFSEVLGH